MNSEKHETAVKAVASDMTVAPENARKMPVLEFIALMALISAVTAFSVDSMLPALDLMREEFQPENPNRPQLVLATFALGLGLGTIFSGPLSDWLGRNKTITLGFGVYILASIVSALSTSLDMLLIARFVMGIGASAPRIASVALVRDLYSGREMARIVSFVMMVFMIVPAAAPALGEVIMNLGSWRYIFYAFVLFGLLTAGWLNLRQPETLPVEMRKPLTVKSLWHGICDVLSSRQVRLCAVAMMLGFGQMFSLLMSSQQIFSQTYGEGERFTMWFAIMALLSIMGTLINARYVVRVGMRYIINVAYAAQTLISALFLVGLLTGTIPSALAFPVFFIWAVSLMSMSGLTFGNLNALAMQSKGEIAGTTASVVSAISTLGGGVIAMIVGMSYNGTVIPIVLATMLCSGSALLIVKRLG